MENEYIQSGLKGKKILPLQYLYGFTTINSYSVIIYAALSCTLAVKFFHSIRLGLAGEYFGWVLADISVLLAIEVVLTTACFYKPRRSVVRTVTIVAAIVCTWSFMNAGWLIRTGTQILPTVILPLFYDPLNSLGMVVVNLIKMPMAAFALVIPGAITFVFFFSALKKAPLPTYVWRGFVGKISVLMALICVTSFMLVCSNEKKHSAAQQISDELKYNCHFRAVKSLILRDPEWLTKTDLVAAKRIIPAFDQVQIPTAQGKQLINHNILIVVLEGVQYGYTSLADKQTNLTLYRFAAL